MVKTKRIVYDVKTGKQWEEEIEFTPMPTEPMPEPLDLTYLSKLIKYTKNMGWVSDNDVK